MSALISLLTFSWMKDYRTFAIVAIVCILYVAENVFGLTIPGVAPLTLNDVLIALGLGTAAAHVPAGAIPASNNRG